MVTNRPITLDHLKSKKKPVIKKCWIPLDSELAEAHEEALNKVASLRGRHRTVKPDEKAAISAELKEAEVVLEKALENLRANSAVFKFRSIGRKKFDKLVGEHPPTKDQIQEVKDAGQDATQLRWNPETFSPVLIAQCSVEPVMTEQDVQAMFDDDAWNASELGAMFMAALQANMEHYSHNLDRLGKG